MAGQRHLRFWDVILYGVSMNLGIRWLATAAASGPASLPIWLIAAFTFLTPLVITATELVGRSEGEGAIYAWTRDAFGPFAGFLCGWIYWLSNLPYFCGLLFFVIEVVLSTLPPEQRATFDGPTMRIVLASTLCVLLLALNLFGLGRAKWLPIIGAIASFAVYGLILAIGAILGVQGHAATDFARSAYVPPLDANAAILWSTIVFAYVGAEGLPLLRNEIEGGMPRLVRAMIFIGVLLACAYLFGTASMLSIMAPEQASRLSGLPETIAVGLSRMGVSQLGAPVLWLLVIGSLGGYSSWFAAAARLPYAAGIDRTLPPIFAKRDERTGAPVAAMILQTVLVLLLIVISQAGASARAAYDFIIAMTVLSVVFPYLFMFAAFIKVQSKPAPAGAWTSPGGPGVARIIGWTGLVVSMSAMICSLAPSPDAADPVGSTVKLLAATVAVVLSGSGLYAFAHFRRANAA